MSLQPKVNYVVPAETKRVAEAIFPKGSFCLTLSKELSGFIHDQDFDNLFSTQGQPAVSPWRLA